MERKGDVLETLWRCNYEPDELMEKGGWFGGGWGGGGEWGWIDGRTDGCGIDGFLGVGCLGVWMV